MNEEQKFEQAVKLSSAFVRQYIAVTEADWMIAAHEVLLYSSGLAMPIVRGAISVACEIIKCESIAE